MSNQNHLVIGNYTLETEGALSLVSKGNELQLEVTGDDAMLLGTSSKGIGLVAGPAILSLLAESGSAGEATLLGGPEGKITQSVGLPELGPVVKLEPEAITLSIGPPGAGASIRMTAEGIIFKVAEVTMSITAEGITEDVAECTRELTPEGHNLTAGETEFNLGVQGETVEAPTEENEVEGGTVDNETLGSHSTDAAKNEDAGIIITE